MKNLFLVSLIVIGFSSQAPHDNRLSLPREHPDKIREYLGNIQRDLRSFIDEPRTQEVFSNIKIFVGDREISLFDNVKLRIDSDQALDKLFAMYDMLKVFDLAALQMSYEKEILEMTDNNVDDDLQEYLFASRWAEGKVFNDIQLIRSKLLEENVVVNAQSRIAFTNRIKYVVATFMNKVVGHENFKSVFPTDIEYFITRNFELNSFFFDEIFHSDWYIKKLLAVGKMISAFLGLASQEQPALGLPKDVVNMFDEFYQEINFDTLDQPRGREKDFRNKKQFKQNNELIENHSEKIIEKFCEMTGLFLKVIEDLKPLESGLCNICQDPIIEDCILSENPFLCEHVDDFHVQCIEKFLKTPTTETSFLEQNIFDGNPNKKCPLCRAPIDENTLSCCSSSRYGHIVD